ncbi:hypothetical protein CI238_09924 [Colletotrichum incanum]|uniref:C2H2-type domain-containing protein n=1 Tax=Colletotrichum incanum TaxID=1573173 RepID=A0A167DRD4_COLIC|nr:hypothetical protein CI238_09924 [Colletotrichum incanum]
MHLSTISLVLALTVTGAVAGLHNDALCVTGRTRSPIGGTGFSVSYSWAKDYEIHKEAAECACKLYKARNTGNKQWDKCPDCFYSLEQLTCHSEGWHIGGDEFEIYCSKRCGAQGSEAN